MKILNGTIDGRARESRHTGDEGNTSSPQLFGIDGSDKVLLSLIQVGEQRSVFLLQFFLFAHTRLSDHYATADILWSSFPIRSGEGTSSPDSPKTVYSHICNRSAPSMSVNVGVTFVVYQGRSLTTWEPS